MQLQLQAVQVKLSIHVHVHACVRSPLLEQAAMLIVRLSGHDVYKGFQFVSAIGPNKAASSRLQFGLASSIPAAADQISRRIGCS
jgi:hypothetical protein